jgi:CubicO group peptidase (beta-lactamase class C family)
MQAMYSRSGQWCALFLLVCVQAAAADPLDDFVNAQMAKRQVPGLSLAIIEDGGVIKAQGYGVVENGTDKPVTTKTRFQAGSISKSVAAVGALRLVDEGKLSLSEDVNRGLTTWKVPENEFAKEHKVTLKNILSHSAGFTVHGFPGYAVDVPRPTLLQILNGEKPSNTAPVRVDFVPDSLWRYSGGGYTVAQQLMIDVSGKPFPEYMREAVLNPLDMSESTYEQPLPSDKAQLTATGHRPDGSLVAGRWHIYPEMAAAGLWTTPSDLAQFEIALQHSLAGEPHSVLSQEIARQMIANVKNDDGLGVFVSGRGTSLRFDHDGQDEGFDSVFVAYARTGQGAVVMINKNDNSGLPMDTMTEIARQYHWPDYPTFNLHASAAPASVDRGSATDITVTAKNRGTDTAESIIQTVVKDSSGAEVFKQAATEASFPAETAKSYHYSFTPPAAGKFTVVISAFGPNWSPLYRRIDGAATITAK